MPDPATVNALKDLTKAVQDQNRTLKDIHRAVTALNTNLVEAVAALRPEPQMEGGLDG